jgi:hypothetical protein
MLCCLVSWVIGFWPEEEEESVEKAKRCLWTTDFICFSKQ